MTTLERKTLPVEPLGLKGGTTLVALASERSLDLVGDVIEAGAYDAWLADFRAGRTRPVTLNDSHRTGSIHDVVGKLVAARVVPHGLETEFQFIPDDPAADAARKRVELGAVSGVSIGYQIKRSRQPTPEERARGVLRVLLEITIHEVSLTQVPAQPRAVVLRTVGSGKDAAPAHPPVSSHRFDLAPGWDLPPAGDRRMSVSDEAELRAALKQLRERGPMNRYTKRKLEYNLRKLRDHNLRTLFERVLRNRPAA